MKKFHRFTIAATFLGLFLLIFSGYSFYQARKFIDNAIKVDGIVNSLKWGTVEDSSGDQSHYASIGVQFVTLNGEKIEFNPDAVDINPPAYKEGQKVIVYYIPSNPDDAKVDSLTSLWFPATVSSLIGLIAFLLGLASTKFRWLSSSKEDKFEIEHKQQISFLLKYIFLFLLLFITTIAYINHKSLIEGNLLLKAVFFVVGIFIVILMLRSFIQIFISILRTHKLLVGETENALLKIKVKSYNHPLILKYEVIFPGILIGIAALSLYFYLLGRVSHLLAIIALLFTIIGGILETLSKLSLSVTTIIGRENLSTETKILGNKGLSVTKWKDIMPYFKRVEFRGQDQCVIIYTSMPWAFQQDNFSPFRYFIGPIWGRVYANFFIPVNTRKDAEQIINLVEQIKNNSITSSSIDPDI